MKDYEIKKKNPEVPGAGRRREWQYHGSDTSTFPRTVYVLKSESQKTLPSTVVYYYCAW
jgi:hypothetical protein